MKKYVIKTGDGNSISIHAHLDRMANPQPSLRNLPYGAEIKKRRMKIRSANPNIRIRE
jgi:hypothetical protein